jgi:hypothetical protein
MPAQRVEVVRIVSRCFELVNGEAEGFQHVNGKGRLPGVSERGATEDEGNSAAWSAKCKKRAPRKQRGGPTSACVGPRDARASIGHGSRVPAPMV